MDKAVKIILINQKREILLQLRDNKPEISCPNYWDILGGKIEPKESLTEAIRREVKEEINIDIPAVQFIGKVNVKKSDIVLNDCENFIFLGKIDLPVEKIKLNEGQRLGYFNIEDLKKIKFVSFWQEFIKNNEKVIKY